LLDVCDVFVVLGEHVVGLVFAVGVFLPFCVGGVCIGGFGWVGLFFVLFFGHGFGVFVWVWMWMGVPV
jgi:hypothetical protein